MCFLQILKNDDSSVRGNIMKNTLHLKYSISSPNRSTETKTIRYDISTVKLSASTSATFISVSHLDNLNSLHQGMLPRGSIRKVAHQLEDNRRGLLSMVQQGPRLSSRLKPRFIKTLLSIGSSPYIRGLRLVPVNYSGVQFFFL